jgi:gluconolactonase
VLEAVVRRSDFGGGDGGAPAAIMAAARHGRTIMTFRLTRRHMLASAAAGGAAFSTGICGVASAQSGKRIEKFAPELDKIIGTDEPMNQLADGVGGDNGPAEGPVWWKEDGYLLFSDINGNRRMKYTPGQGTTEFKKPTNGANRLTRDLQGRLVACEGVGRRVIREEPDGTTTVMASSFQGRRLNRPNDVVVKSDGAIYFSDPTDLTYAGVYRVSPDLGTLTLLVDDFITPNGLAFSPDESVLYINDSRRRHIRAFDMAPNGTLARQTDRVFAELGGAEPGVPDGMKVDSAGNVYCGGSGGLWILDSKGKKLGRIVHGQPQTTNLAFGGPDWKTLYFTNWNFLGEPQDRRNAGAGGQKGVAEPAAWDLGRRCATTRCRGCRLAARDRLVSTREGLALPCPVSRREDR